MGLGADAFPKTVLVWEAHCRDNGFQQADHITKFQEVKMSRRKERKLPSVLGICSVPQENATCLAPLSHSYNKTLTISEQKQKCKDTVQRKSFFCTFCNRKLCIKYNGSQHFFLLKKIRKYFCLGFQNGLMFKFCVSYLKKKSKNYSLIQLDQPV